ncbi:hypothetical protein J2X65_001078 [Ancylobacter sp. 3268]|uniref:hypothetical protein n=1 Tax=Ancylobacter sp. 3268 TaxID=2817752 RepID=UPI00285DB560|nr:hypothetical protein [Ancylobacter sp. 3268]MDR6951729.1 hypothetical protein [Ancylobacter sp. 3268]
MLRAFLRGHRPTRLLAGAAAAALLFPAVAGAQSMGGPLPYDPVDPWAGVTVIVTPQQDRHEPEAAATAVPPPRPADAPEPEPQVADTPIEQWTPPSLYESLDLGLGGLPELEPEKPAPNALLPQRKSVATSKTAKLPTSVQFVDRGPVSIGVSTSMSASAPVSSPTNRQTGSGSGEVKGRVGYSMDNLSVYGTSQLGASASTGTPSVYDGYTVGSTYSMPLDNLGLGKGDKLGATVEMDSSSTVNTGVELRAPMGSYERFLSVQRSAPVGADASGVVKAGVLGRF